MGKVNFDILYKRAKATLKTDQMTVKISAFSDEFEEGKNYAGMIVYAVDNKFQWKNEAGLAKGWNGRTFYLIIQCTDNWPEEVFARAGKGMVHDYLIKNTLGIDYSEEVKNKPGRPLKRRRVCCGGFAYHNGELKFSSIWLNQHNQVGCQTDDSKLLSWGEQELVEFCFGWWKRKGAGFVIRITENVEQEILKQCELEREENNETDNQSISYEESVRNEYQAQQEVYDDSNCCCLIQ